MVISNIIGGLGNQMFQYAAGRALALRNNTELRLDISGFENYALHQGFELQSVFSCANRIASSDDMKGVLGWQSSPWIRRILSRPAFAPLRRKELLFEPYFWYWDGINQAPSNSYLMGYWQSEKYFGDHAATIRSDFAFRRPLDSLNENIIQKIEASDAVSLHIRRGDYAKNPKTLSVHGLCSLDYYRAAIELVSSRIGSAHFFIFSDDIEWVRQNLILDFPCEFIDHNKGQESYKDMQLMSLCRHHIIANSSFSWWGAWLNPLPEKIVVAPSKWFTNDRNVNDLIPAGWIRL